MLGGDNVRAYAVKEEAGSVWVDVSDPPSDALQAQILKGLRVAYNQRDFGRISREVARLHFNQLDPAEAVRRSRVPDRPRVVPEWLTRARGIRLPDGASRAPVRR